MKIHFILLTAAALFVGCNRDDAHGGAGASAGPPVTGRGTGHGDVGGNGKVYDRGEPTNDPNAESYKPGSGRLDQGGGATAGGAVRNSWGTNSGNGTAGATGNQP